MLSRGQRRTRGRDGRVPADVCRRQNVAALLRPRGFECLFESESTHRSILAGPLEPTTRCQSPAVGDQIDLRKPVYESMPGAMSMESNSRKTAAQLLELFPGAHVDEGV